jgi:hypothetical protein
LNLLFQWDKRKSLPGLGMEAELREGTAMRRDGGRGSVGPAERGPDQFSAPNPGVSLPPCLSPGISLSYHWKDSSSWCFWRSRMFFCVSPQSGGDHLEKQWEQW